MKSFSPVGTLVVLTLLEGLSTFGRTSAFSPFLPSLCSDWALSITQIGGAYMIANLIAGFLLPFVGKLYDRMKVSDFTEVFIIVFAVPCALTGVLGTFKNTVVECAPVWGSVLFWLLLIRKKNPYLIRTVLKIISKRKYSRVTIYGIGIFTVSILFVLSLFYFLIRGLISESEAPMALFCFVMSYLAFLYIIYKRYKGKPTGRHALPIALSFEMCYCFKACKEASPWEFLAVVTCAFIGIRLSVQAYALAVRASLAVWFPKKRGFATGCTQLFVTLVTASTPVVCYQISRYGSYGIFFCALGTVWVILLFVCSLFLPNVKVSQLKTSEAAINIGKKQRYSNKNRVMFIFIWILLFFRSTQNSGIAFHLVPMCRDFGVNAKTVSAAFMPISLLAIGMTFLFGHYFKRLGSRMSLGLFLLSDAGMLYAVKHIDIGGMLWLFIACTGLYWGINNIIASMVIPALFGINRIGVLNGFAFGAVSLGSAVGPFFFSIMKDATSYKSALALCIDGVFLLLCLFALLQNRIKPTEVDA